MNQPKLWRDLDPEAGEILQGGDRYVWHPLGQYWYLQRPYTPEPSPVQGWISLAERKPTEADADERGKVAYRYDNERYFDTWDAWRNWGNPNSDKGYWMASPKLPKPDPDKAAFEALTRKYQDTWDQCSALMGWQAALDYRDGKEKP